MNYLRLTNKNHPYFPELWNLYQDAFPENEKHSREIQEKFLAHPQHHFDAWSNEGALIGFMAWWQHENFWYMEHFAIYPQFRGKEFGSTILGLWIKRANGLPIILEVDPVIDPPSQRRFQFYTKEGFHRAPFVHNAIGQGELGNFPEWWVLSYPHQISESVYTAFVSFQRKHILHYLHFS